jgi:hypothetical protein
MKRLAIGEVFVVVAATLMALAWVFHFHYYHHHLHLTRCLHLMSQRTCLHSSSFSSTSYHLS